MVMVFKVKTVLEMFEQIHPVVFRQFCQILDAIGTSHEQETIDQVYQNLTPMNFSKGFLEQLSALYPRAIHVMPVLQVFWSDWGSRQRILEARQVLKRAGRGKPQPKALSDEPDERTAGTTVCA
jgi:mannose-1-phosphate guanylyltransferase